MGLSCSASCLDAMGRMRRQGQDSRKIVLWFWRGRACCCSPSPSVGSESNTTGCEKGEGRWFGRGGWSECQANWRAELAAGER